MERKRITQVGILLAGCALGAAIGGWTARELQIGNGKDHVFNYASRVKQLGDQIGVETLEAVAAISHDDLPFCSDEELAFMRHYVFHAPHIRDIGRTRDGKLWCTTGLGRLNPALDLAPADIVNSGMLLKKQVPLAISNGTLGVIAERDGVSIVFNPDLIENLEEPPMHYSAVYFNDDRSRMLAFPSEPGRLTIADILAGKPLERDGIYYQPMCAVSKMRCTVAFESRQAMLLGGRGRIVWLVLAGAVLGGLLAGLLLRLSRERHSMESQLRRALRRGSLTLVYQPIVDLATGRIVAAEALARWVDEDGESIGPEIFVALAEARGFAREITHTVVGCAAEELFDMLAAGKFRVTINIAPEDLGDEAFFRHLDQSMALARIDPSRVVIELTEHSLADYETAVVAIERLRRRGHSVYIDDFGTGYSNLAALHRLNVDGIKIDRAFTRTVGTAAGAASVVPQILDIARQLGLAVIVEGIETEEQAEYFRSAGRGILGQGWLFGKPVPAAQIRAMLPAAD